MTFPSGTLLTNGVDSGTSSPADGRQNIKDAITALNAIIDSPNTAYNVCVLDGNGQVPSTSIPGTVVTPSDLSLQPGSGVVKINDFLRLQIVTKTSVLARSYNAFGDMVLYADDLTGANAGIAIWDGSHWKIIASLSGLSNLS